MKKMVIVVVLVLAILAALSSAAVAAPPLAQATGGGTNPAFGIDLTVAFNAQQVDVIPPGPGGNAKGQAEWNGHGLGSFHVDVLYLAVDPVTGTEAWIGGVITKASDPTLIGLEILWEVQDNGTGSKATGPDQLSFPFVGPGVAAAALGMPDLSFSFIPWVNGNIQIK